MLRWSGQGHSGVSRGCPALLWGSMRPGDGVQSGEPEKRPKAQCLEEAATSTGLHKDSMPVTAVDPTSGLRQCVRQESDGMKDGIGPRAVATAHGHQRAGCCDILFVFAGKRTTHQGT